MHKYSFLLILTLSSSFAATDPSTPANDPERTLLLKSPSESLSDQHPAAPLSLIATDSGTELERSLHELLVRQKEKNKDHASNLETRIRELRDEREKNAKLAALQETKDRELKMERERNDRLAEQLSVLQETSDRELSRVKANNAQLTSLVEKLRGKISETESRIATTSSTKKRAEDRCC